MELFSVQIGLEDDAAKGVLARSLKPAGQRELLQNELRRLLDDKAAPWVDLVANSEYELDEPEDAEEARSIILDALWDTVFPGEPRPYP